MLSNKRVVSPLFALAGLSAALALQSACSADAPAPTTLRFDTLPGGAVHVRNPRSGVWREAERWRLVGGLSIGSAGGERDAFERVADLAIDGRGFIWVADEGAARIHVFGPDGTWIRTIGREGRGPGEYGRPDGMSFDARGRLWIADGLNSRYTLVDSAGGYVASHPRTIRSGSNGHLTIPDSSEWLIDHTSVPASWEDRFFVPGLVAAPLDDAAAPVFSDTVVLPWLDFPVFRSPRGSGAVSLEPSVPFEARIRWAVDPTSGQVWVGRTDSYRLTRLDMDSVPRLVVSRDSEPVRVDAAELDSVVADLEERWRGIRIDEDRIPSVKPFFRWLSVSEEGYLWVGLEDERGREHERIDVFDPDGVLLGTVEVPGRVTDPGRVPRFVPVVTASALYGVVTDELDVQSVVRYRIERPRDR